MSRFDIQEKRHRIGDKSMTKNIKLHAARTTVQG